MEKMWRLLISRVHFAVLRYKAFKGNNLFTRVIMNFKTIVAAAMLFIAPMAANAATVYGQLDVSGTVNLGGSTFSPTGNVDFVGSGIALIATNDFASYVNAGDTATVIDIDFSTPGVIWSVGGFTFTATSFSGYSNTSPFAFTAVGQITGNGFSATDGILTFSAQGNGSFVNVSFSSTTATVPVPAAGLLLLTAVGGLGVARRRKKAA